MTSHAALVARGWGKCCVVGADEIEVDCRRKTLTVGDVEVSEAGARAPIVFERHALCGYAHVLAFPFT